MRLLTKLIGVLFRRRFRYDFYGGRPSARLKSQSNSTQVSPAAGIGSGWRDIDSEIAAHADRK